jgi:hypothetical protein
MARVGDKKSGKSGKTAAKRKPKEAEQGPGVRYVGCIGSEAPMSADKVYGGGSTGAALELAVSFAKDQSKKYVALARVGSDGHSFAFNDFHGDAMIDDAGCQLKCIGQYEDQVCGCADASCGELETVPGEDNLRRWAVYEIDDVKKGSKNDAKNGAKKDAKKTDKKAGKKDKKKKTEL